MLFLGNFQSSVFSTDFGRSGNRTDVRVVKFITPVVVAIIYKRFGYKLVFILMMLVNFIITSISITIMIMHQRD